MNTVTLQPTEFINQQMGSSTFGFRMYDDEGQTYDNTWDSIPDNNLEILALAMQSDDWQVIDMLSLLLKYKKGLYIGKTWYEWDQIKHLWN